MKNRIILHIDMDYFFAQVEERENPHFKGKPIVVGADPKCGRGRGVVSTCNYEARKYGIKAGMPISWAYRACPKAIFLPVNIEFYQKVSEKIMEIIKKYSKIWEVVSLDEAYLNLSFLGSFKKAEKLAKKLKEEIFEKEKLTATVGIGPNKVIAKMVAEQAKPNGLSVITPAKIKAFLEPLDIQELPGVGPKTAAKLGAFNVHTIKELKKLSQKGLIELFGVVGKTIYERARGIDTEPVVSEEMVKSIGQEHTFQKDTRDSEVIFKTYRKIIRNVYQELKNYKFLFRTVTAICRFQGFETHTKSKTLKEPTDDLDVLKKEAKKLLLKLMMQNLKLIRMIGLRVKVVKKT